MMRVSGILIPLLCIAGSLLAQTATTQNQPAYTQPYAAKDYRHLIGMPGFSEGALTAHFTLYQGYVKNANELSGILKDLEQKGQQSSPYYSSIHRHFAWEWDGMRLHEYYFDGLGGSGQPNTNSQLYKDIVAQYGSFDAWQKDFVAVGSMRGIGWAILYQDPRTGKLINCWINEHPDGHLAGANPLLAMDVFEHAYLFDYGLDRAGYIKAFMQNIKWDTIEGRYKPTQS